MRQTKECWRKGIDPVEYTKEHNELVRAFETFQADAGKIYQRWRARLGVS